MLLVPLLLLACKPPADSDTPPAWVDASDVANPIVPEHPLLPWPSEQYLVPDDSTVTGWRLDLPADLLPTDLPPEMFNTDDGTSRISPIVTVLPGGIDPTSLPDVHDWGATLDVATSPVLLLRADDLSPVPLLVEIDVNVENPAFAPLILRPHRALRPDTRYVVLLRDSLRAADGSPAVGSPFVRDLLDGSPADDPAFGFWDHAFETVRATLDGVDIDPATVLQAWTLHTRSEEQVMAKAITTQDVAATAPLGAYTLQPTIYEADKALIYGTLTVPSFLDATRRIRLDAAGAPIQQGTLEAPFLVTIPSTVEEGSHAVLVGHGFFSAIEEPTWSNMFDALAQWKMSAVATEFFGFSEASLADAVPILAGKLSDLDTLMDQQLQSHVDFTLVHRLTTEVLADEITVDFGEGPLHPIAGDFMSYLGASNGGTQGLVMMTTSHTLTRGGLIVAGGGWSHMLQRATQFSSMGGILQIKYPDPVEMQLVLSLCQQVFDPADSLNYTDHLVDDRLPGRPPAPEMLLVEAVGDSQVTNLVTDWVAGNAGFVQLSPAVRPVWGLEQVAGPAPDGAPTRAAMEIYDLLVPPLPEGNQPPEENGAHNDVRLLQAYRDQVGTFLQTGHLVHTCDGPCDPE